MLARRNKVTRSPDIWPGFVDAISTLLLVLIFLLVVFVLAQFFLSHALSGRDEALNRLNQQVAELADLLALEELANIGLSEDVAQLGTQLQASNKDRENLNRRLFTALGENDEIAQEVVSLKLSQADAEATSQEVSLRLSAALTALEAEKLALKESQKARLHTTLLEKIRSHLMRFIINQFKYLTKISFDYFIYCLIYKFTQFFGFNIFIHIWMNFLL